MPDPAHNPLDFRRQRTVGVAGIAAASFLALGLWLGIDYLMSPLAGMDSLGARMVRRRQQRLDDREALRRYGESALAAAIGEMFHPFARVGAAAAVTDYLQIHTRW